jgi:hypothetical protein
MRYVKPILPVPVLAEAMATTEQSASGEARESTNLSGASPACSKQTQDSRGGQKLL